MEFYEDGDYIMSTWHPGTHYQGWVNTMHGGILSTLIDEVCGWVVTRKLQTSGYTVQLNVKFRKAVPTTEPELTIRAKVTRQVRNLATSMRRSSTQEVKSAMRARPSIS